MDIVFSSLDSEPVFSHQYIIQFCFPDEGYYIVTHSSLLDFSIFVKKGPPRLVREARTQAYFYDQAQQSPNAPRVARVYEVFADGQGSTYLVMEFISAPSFEALIEGASSNLEKEGIKATAFNEIANAVEWLLNCPVPEGVSIGPVGGRYIQHLFFHMEEARVAFVTAGALEAYVNKALSRLPGKIKRTIQLTDEPLFYSPSDVVFRNFLWDGKVLSFIDWQHVNLLPQSFASFYFHTSSNQLLKEVSNRITLERSTKLSLIQMAAGLVLQAGISSFGVDQYGMSHESSNVLARRRR